MYAIYKVPFVGSTPERRRGGMERETDRQTETEIDSDSQGARRVLAMSMYLLV